ncbi:sulfite exporter TauE/SafE family protein [Halalkalibacter oceani]|uniref:sulfite exporter TauE/SafE family protein n=1 Tax=Halalkalibacter oceani TaxID=1653776 RepID=UPI00339A28DD
MDIILFILLGGLIGIFSGFFGIGGGIILTPLLLLLGFSPTFVIGTSLMLSLGTSISGAIAHFRMGNIQWKYVAIINVMGIIGTQIAHPLITKLESLGYAETAISVFYIMLLGFFAVTLLKKQKNKQASRPEPAFPLLIAGLIGLGAGFISSALGVSGGFFIVPLLISLLGLKAPHAVGTSLASVVFIVTAGFISYSVSSTLDYIAGISLIIGTFLGAPLGAKSTLLVKETFMRLLLGSLYICMILSVIVNLFLPSFIGLIIIGAFALFFFTTLIRQKWLSRKEKEAVS